MASIKSYMASLGAFLVIAGVVSIVLSFFNYNLRILMWIDRWGPTAGWIIRIALVVAGALLFFIGRASSKQE